MRHFLNQSIDVLQFYCLGERERFGLMLNYHVYHLSICGLFIKVQWSFNPVPE